MEYVMYMSIICSIAAVLRWSQPNLQKKTIRVNQWARQTNGGGINVSPSVLFTKQLLNNLQEGRCVCVCLVNSLFKLCLSVLEYKVYMCCRYVNQSPVNVYIVWVCACYTVSTCHTWIFHIPHTFIYEKILLLQGTIKLI